MVYEEIKDAYLSTINPIFNLEKSESERLDKQLEIFQAILIGSARMLSEGKQGVD